MLDGRETPNYTSHGDIFPIHGAKMTPNHPHPGRRGSQSADREARQAGGAVGTAIRITADRGRITLEVNGKAVSGGFDITPRKGYIALESEGAPAMFRNLRIRELPSASAIQADQEAAADEGYGSLYSGVDLSGWTEDEAAHGRLRFGRLADRGRWTRAHAPKARCARSRRFRISTSSSTGVVAHPGENEKPEPAGGDHRWRRRAGHRRLFGRAPPAVVQQTRRGTDGGYRLESDPCLKAGRAGAGRTQRPGALHDAKGRSA